MPAKFGGARLVERGGLVQRICHRTVWIIQRVHRVHQPRRHLWPRSILVLQPPLQGQKREPAAAAGARGGVARMLGVNKVSALRRQVKRQTRLLYWGVWGLPT